MAISFTANQNLGIWKLPIGLLLELISSVLLIRIYQTVEEKEIQLTGILPVMRLKSCYIRREQQ